jgi:xanthine phosphoribosyltransferase
LANGCALDGLIALTQVAGARLAGAGVVIEKGFQNGGKRLRESNIRVESLAIIESMGADGICFKEG